LGLALLTNVGLLGLPWAYRLFQVLRGAGGDEPAPADAILVLGRRLEHDQLTPVFEARLAHAERLWRQGLAPRLFVAGGATGASARSEAEAGWAWLVARGVPGARGPWRLFRPGPGRRLQRRAPGPHREAPAKALSERFPSRIAQRMVARPSRG